MVPLLSSEIDSKRRKIVSFGDVVWRNSSDSKPSQRIDGEALIPAYMWSRVDGSHLVCCEYGALCDELSNA